MTKGKLYKKLYVFLFDAQKLDEYLWRRCVDALPWYWVRGSGGKSKAKYINRNGFSGLYKKILVRGWKVAGRGAARLDFPSGLPLKRILHTACVCADEGRIQKKTIGLLSSSIPVLIRHITIA